MKVVHAVWVVVVCLVVNPVFAAITCAKIDGDPPGAVDDVVFIETRGQVLNIPVLLNDAVRAGGKLQIVAFTPSTAHADVALSADGTVLRYTHRNGPDLVDDSFQYTVKDATQVNSPISEGTVSVKAPARTLTIAFRPKCTTAPPDPTVNCVSGGEYLFDATLSHTDGLKSITWTFHDGAGSLPWVGGTRAWFMYVSPGSYMVRARADYYSGASVSGSVLLNVQLSNELTWDAFTLDPYAGSVEPVRAPSLTIITTVDRASLGNFSQGANAAQVWIKLGDSYEECGTNNHAVTCGQYASVDCSGGSNGYCTGVSATFLRSGTYPVYARVRDGNGNFYNFAKYVTVTNTAPAPSFTVTRPNSWRRYLEFDPQGSKDEFVDGPAVPNVYQWDSGDGMTETKTDESVTGFGYSTLGKFTASLQVTDTGGLTGYYSKEIELTNNPPVPVITVYCQTGTCTLSGNNSLDDERIESRAWKFSDQPSTTYATTASVTRTMPYGCHVATFTATDNRGASASASQTFVTGTYDPINNLFTKRYGATVDTHATTFRRWHDLYETELNTTGNLNGILEPGERVVVEPTRTLPASIVPYNGELATFASSNNAAVTGTVQKKVAQYDASLGYTNCWATGDCYVLEAKSNGTRTTPHADLTLHETTLSDDGELGPGGPLVIHVGNSFADVPSSIWWYGIAESGLHAGITSGCGNGNFCPNDVINRGPIARWVLRAKEGSTYTPPACVTPPFNDVPCSDPEAPWIAELKARAITTGTGNNNYSPAIPATRADMAVFILRALEGGSYAPPACTTAPYPDVPCSSFGAAFIAELKRRNFATECATAGSFCPGQSVTRLDGVFLLTRAFSLSIDRRMCAPTVPVHVANPPAGSYFN